MLSERNTLLSRRRSVARHDEGNHKAELFLARAGQKVAERHADHVLGGIEAELLGEAAIAQPDARLAHDALGLLVHGQVGGDRRLHIEAPESLGGQIEKMADLAFQSLLGFACGGAFERVVHEMLHPTLAGAGLAGP